MVDPVFKAYDKWYFWDETWANKIGPFDTEEQAKTALKKHCEELNYEEGGDKMVRIMQFDLREFNWNMREAFAILFKIYQNVLAVDPNWHFFYEGNFTTLRCGEDFVDAVRFQLQKNEIKFEEPREWVEPWELTRTFQDCFGPIFHGLSVLIMELFKRKNIIMGSDKLILNSADRIIHPFLNMATYLKYFQAGRGGSEPLVKWEAEVMASLTIQRAHIAGIILGEQRMKKIMEKERRENEEKKTNEEGKGRTE